MACCRTGDKPLSEPMVAYFTDAHMCHSASVSQTGTWLILQINVIVVWFMDLLLQLK